MTDATPKKAPARKAAAKAPENKTAPSTLSPAERQERVELAQATAALAKDEDGELDVRAELISINRKLEALASASNVRLPSR